MRILVQRVKSAEVVIDGEKKSEIGVGLLILVGIEDIDSDEDVEWLCAKVSKLRLFDDAEGVMNLSVKDISGEVMVISQFTLHAQTKKGNRPSYIKAARPEKAIPLYEKFVAVMSRELGRDVATGTFGADMKVTLTNDGPVTIFIDSQNKE